MRSQKTRKLIFAALMAAFTTVATMVIKFPTPTMGYIHLGDGLVLLCGILLGPWAGAAAAGVGSMLADLISGYAAWVPGTLLIKAATAVICGLLFQRLGKGGLAAPLRALVAGIPAELVMAAGYFGYEILLSAAAGSGFGAAVTASAAGIPFNLLQGAVGVVIAMALVPVLSHSSTVMQDSLRAKKHVE